MNEVYITLAIVVVSFGMGFLLSIPIMKNQYRNYLEEQKTWEEADKIRGYKLNSLQDKIEKLKSKLKKKKK